MTVLNGQALRPVTWLLPAQVDPVVPMSSNECNCYTTRRNCEGSQLSYLRGQDDVYCEWNDGKCDLHPDLSVLSRGKRLLILQYQGRNKELNQTLPGLRPVNALLNNLGYYV